MEIEIRVDEIIGSLSRREKKQLYKAMLEDPDVLNEKERLAAAAEEKRQEELILMDRLRAMSKYELKQALCNLLNVASYTDEQALRTALEPIVKA